MTAQPRLALWTHDEDRAQLEARIREQAERLRWLEGLYDAAYVWSFTLQHDPLTSAEYLTDTASREDEEDEEYMARIGVLLALARCEPHLRKELDALERDPAGAMPAVRA